MKKMEGSVEGKKKAHFMTQSTTLSVNHGDNSDMTWACMAAKGTGILTFVNDFTAEQ